MTSECVCKPRWSRNGEGHPAANLVLSVPDDLDAILDIELEVKRLALVSMVPLQQKPFSTDHFQV
jgi:hypothetical protein